MMTKLEIDRGLDFSRFCKFIIQELKFCNIVQLFLSQFLYLVREKIEGNYKIPFLENRGQVPFVLRIIL